MYGSAAMLKYRLLRQSGAETLEFLVVVFLLAIAVIPALYLFAPSLKNTICNIVNSISGTTSDCAGGAATIFQDDFSTCPGAWGSLTGSLSCVDGRKCSGVNQNVLTLANDTNGQDYTISTNAQLKSGNGYGIVFRASGPSVGNAKPTNGYSFQYDPGLGKLVFRKYVNGVEKEPFASYKPTEPPAYDWWGGPRDIKVVVKGNTFTAYVDGQQMLEATDNDFTSGQAGLRTWYGNDKAGRGNQSCFDDFKVTTP